jgi:hypothetical protein
MTRMRDLERELRRLRVEWPATPDIAAAIAPRLATEPQDQPARVSRRRPRRWAIAGVLLALLGGVAAVEPARSAILELFGLDGARIERRETVPQVPNRVSPLGNELGLGRRVSAARARELADFTPAPPSGLPAPDAVYYSGATPEGIVSYVYKPRPGLPAMSETGTGLIVTELVASVERPLLQKIAGPGTEIQPVHVDGARGYRLAGTAHAFAFTDSRGRIQFQTERAAGPTLLLERDGLLIRIEGDVSGDRAIEIARQIAARR